MRRGPTYGDSLTALKNSIQKKLSENEKTAPVIRHLLSQSCFTECDRLVVIGAVLSLSPHDQQRILETILNGDKS